jgi:hypothetical protein
MFTWAGGPNVSVDGAVPSLNTWYCLDVKVFVGSTTWTLNWKIDNVNQTAGSWSGQTSTTFNTALTLGATSTLGGADTWDGYMDDWIVSQTAADYPIGGGGTKALIPSSDGTHNAGTNVMENQAGADIGVVTAYDLIDAIPMSTATTYIRQLANGTGNYAEVQFANINTALYDIIGAMGLLAYTSETTTTNSGGCIISKDSFSTQTVIWGVTGALADYSDGATTNLFYKSVILTTTTDLDKVNNLKARIGYSGDASPDPYWVNLMVEVAYKFPASLYLYTKQAINRASVY